MSNGFESDDYSGSPVAPVAVAADCFAPDLLGAVSGVDESASSDDLPDVAEAADVAGLAGVVESADFVDSTGVVESTEGVESADAVGFAFVDVGSAITIRAGASPDFSIDEVSVAP